MNPLNTAGKRPKGFASNKCPVQFKTWMIIEKYWTVTTKKHKIWMTSVLSQKHCVLLGPNKAIEQRCIRLRADFTTVCWCTMKKIKEWKNHCSKAKWMNKQDQ